MALINQQPLLSISLILSVAITFDLASRGNPRSSGWTTFLRLGIWIWLVALAFNFFSAHVGEVVLIRLPRWLPAIGGPLTLEALLYGLASGASLFAILLVFATFNVAVESQRLLRWVPAGLYQAGLIVSIAVAFVPQMMRSLQDIREAQQVRGHAAQGLRDLGPIFIPLITTALERSLSLAESMEARGFGGIVTAEPGRERLPRIVTAAGLLALLAGLMWRALRPQAGWMPIGLLGAGTVLTLAAVQVQGRTVRRTHYVHEAWQGRDTMLVLCSVAALVLLTVARARDPAALTYYPYPPMPIWPAFSLLAGLAAVLLTAPALLWARAPDRTRQTGATQPHMEAGAAP